MLLFVFLELPVQIVPVLVLDIPAETQVLEKFDPFFWHPLLFVESTLYVHKGTQGFVWMQSLRGSL